MWANRLNNRAEHNRRGWGWGRRRVRWSSRRRWGGAGRRATGAGISRKRTPAVKGRGASSEPFVVTRRQRRATAGLASEFSLGGGCGETFLVGCARFGGTDLGGDLGAAVGGAG